jgi:hypothetical protein
MCVPLSELIGMYFLCYCQLNGHRVVVKVAVVIVVASVRAVIKIMGYGLENTRVLIPRGDPVSGSTPLFIKASAHIIIFGRTNDHHTIYQDWNEGSGSIYRRSHSAFT